MVAGMPAIPAFPDGQLQQLGYVVENLDDAVQKFKETLGVPSFYIWRDLAAGMTEKTYRGDEADFQFSCAFGYSGDIMVELIQHDSGESIFKDWLNERGPGLHHVCFLMPDGGHFTDAVQAMADRGHPVAMSGRAGDARFSYADTVDLFGVYTELAYGPPEFLAAFDKIKSGDS
ncbi:VOC family protein [Streptomyces kanamyceticus]|uniref:VOC family protein n=1 Tax=Streptomyces kanamyceticus TaxID=1967 RepID=A0A5J6GRY4_STRKN|nr:VOC family protein [Streptomyces kanamyceticus]QEU95756.1 VOC family protein [Streptomyces kanamyceticus]